MYVYSILNYKKILAAEDVQCTSCKLPRDEFCALAKKWARSRISREGNSKKEQNSPSGKMSIKVFFIKGPGSSKRNQSVF